MERARSGDHLGAPGKLVVSVRERHTDASKVKEIQAPVSNLGEGGMFIEMREPPPKGTILEVEFELPGGEARTKVLGIVRWREKAGRRAGVGVRFAPIGRGERSDIRQIIRRRAERPKEKAGGAGGEGRPPSG